MTTPQAPSAPSPLETVVIYLAGPIQDVDRNGAHEWRDTVAEVFADHALPNLPPLVFLNPLDNVDGHDEDVVIHPDPEQGDVTPAEIVDADLEMIDASDAILALWNTDVHMVGTSMEVFYAAHVQGKPVVIWSDTPHEELPVWAYHHSVFGSSDLEACINRIVREVVTAQP